MPTTASNANASLFVNVNVISSSPRPIANKPLFIERRDPFFEHRFLRRKNRVPCFGVFPKYPSLMAEEWGGCIEHIDSEPGSFQHAGNQVVGARVSGGAIKLD